MHWSLGEFLGWWTPLLGLWTSARGKWGIMIPQGEGMESLCSGPSKASPILWLVLICILCNKTVIVSIELSQVLSIILKKYQTNLRGLWEPPNWQPVVVWNVGGLGTSNLQLASKIRAVWLMNPWVFTNSGWLISELDCSTIIWKARYPQPVFMQLIF